MKNKKFNIGLAAVLLVILSISGYFAIAAEYGSKEDPLVTLSYINDVLAPGTTKKIDEIIAAKKKEMDTAMDAKLKEINTAVDTKLAGITTDGAKLQITDELVTAVAEQVALKLSETSAGTAASDWAVIKIPAGKTLTAKVGCEMLLRIGSATCVSGGTPGLINLSSGTDLGNGKALALNNLYICTVEGRGVTSANGCTILVRGAYTIG